MARMSLRAACDQARQWLESNDLDRAIGLCEHILQAHPRNLEAYRILGEACLADRQLDRAQDAFEHVLRSDPENIPAHVGLGIAFERRGKLERAVQEFEQALEIKPDMPELRSQLLRLYSDGGIENAQLRLSRAGLARLYAKGQMLPQAIAELRHVIQEQPDRYDVKVALAETLWRDEQEADAAALCRKLVAERSELLKAQLLLGYLELGTGSPQGESHWRSAATIDPDLTVARAMFDPLPGIAVESPTIEEWDEQAWRRAREEQEQLAATRQMQSVAPVAEPAEVAEEFVPGAAFFASRAPAAPSFDAAGSDDFLASLLDLGAQSPAPTPAEPAAPPPSAEELGLEPDMQPFSLSELGLSEDELAGLDGLDDRDTPAATAAAPVEIPEEPVELSTTQALSRDDLAALSAPSPAAPETPSAPQPDPELDDLSAFSFDLDLPADSDPELDNLPGLSFGAPTTSEAPAPSAPTPAAADDDLLDLGDMKPFSLSDLGLTDDDIAGLDSLEGDFRQPTPAPRTPAPPPALSDLPADLQPFSIDEIDRSGDAPEVEGLPPALQPFSIDDPPPSSQRPRVSGLRPDLGIESGEDEEESGASQRGYSWQQPAQKPETSFSTRPPEPPAEESLFSKLKQRRQSEPVPPAEEPGDVTLAPDEHLGLFSLDDIPLVDQGTSDTPMPQIAGLAKREGTTWTPAPETTPPAAKPIEDLQSALAEGQIKPFSLADLGLSDEEIAQVGGDLPQTEAPAAPPPGTADLVPGAISADAIEPFSLEDLGLSEAEIAALGIGAPAAPAPEPAAPHEHIEIDTDLDLQSALAAGEVKPFSFADLGLSDEEIAALNIAEEGGQAAAPAPAAEPEPELPEFSLDLGLDDEPELAALDLDLGLDSEPPAATAPEPEPTAPAAPHEHIEIDTDLDLQSALAAGEVKPFSFADLGLSDEEIAALGLAEESSEEVEPAMPTAATPAPAAPTPSEEDPLDLGLSFDLEEPAAASPPPPSARPSRPGTGPLNLEDLQPFSLGDFGLDDDSDAPEPLSGDDARLGLTVAELSGLDSGGDINLEGIDTKQVVGLDTSGINTGDPAADRLIALGRQQGFIDISDIIAAVTNPEAEADRIETIGQLLHAHAIEIRDGDEVIDMDAEYTEEEYEAESFEAAQPEAIAPAPAGDIADMAPFSLSELGLSDEEIALLGADAEAAPPPPAPRSPAPRAEELDLLPLSLDDLGFGGEPSSPEPAPAADDQSDMAPFSFGEAPVEEQPAAPPSQPAPPPAPAPAAAPAAGIEGTGNAMLDQYLQRVESDPENHPLRLSVARASARLDYTDLAIRQYKLLVRRGALLEDVVDDIVNLIDENEDGQQLRQLHRALGDAFSKQGLMERAMEVYAWTPGLPKATL